MLPQIYVWKLGETGIDPSVGCADSSPYRGAKNDGAPFRRAARATSPLRGGFW